MFQQADKTLVLLFGILKKNFKVIIKFLLVQLISPAYGISLTVILAASNIPLGGKHKC